MTGPRPAMLILALALLTGCEQDMANQPRYEAYESAPEWPHGQSARKPVEGTVARDAALDPAPSEMPMALTRELLEQGRESYDVFCAPCHGHTGHGDGMIVQRGFPEPPSFHGQRFQQVPPSYFYAVITNGVGAMYSYRARVTPDERWAIAAYIQALQLSQRARPEDLTDAQRARLEGGP